jgi:hypothetical protein
VQQLPIRLSQVAQPAWHSLVLAVLAGHNLQTQHTILSKVHVGLKGRQVVLGVETVEVAAQRLALQQRSQTKCLQPQ